jgi:PAS domain S-box-containing protein
LKLLNYKYEDKNKLYKFVEDNKIKNDQSTFIQVFSSKKDFENLKDIRDELNELLPFATIIGASTAGIIEDDSFIDDEIYLSFSLFEKSKTISVSYCKKDVEFILKNLFSHYINSKSKLIIIFANTYRFDATKLLNEFSSKYPSIVISGGNAGDDYNFEKCLTFTNNCFDCDVSFAIIDSDDLQVSTKQLLNWQTLGQEMVVTKSEASTVYEINGEKAVDIYEHYLGKDVSENILTFGIEFPIIFKSNGIDVARAAIAVDYENGSITFAGEIKQNTKIKFGFANVEHIETKNKEILKEEFTNKSEAIYIYSCSARRLMLGNYLKNEIFNLNQIAPTSGFITYGEFFHDSKSCNNNLLNLTTTYVVLDENKENKPLKFEDIDIKKDNREVTLKALTNLISKTNEDLEENIYYLEQFKNAVRKASIFSITDKNGVIIDTNEKFEKVSGYSRDELIGKRHDIVKSLNMSDEVFAKLWETIESGEIWEGLIENQRKDGSKYYVISQIGPIYYKNGKFREYIGIRTDVTEQEEYKKILKNQLDTTNKSLKENLYYSKQYEDAINSTSLILKTDVDYNIVFANETFCNLSGYKLSELRKMKSTQMRHSKHIQEDSYKSIFTELNKRKVVSRVLTNIKKDGTEYTVSNLFYPIINLEGEVIEYLHVMHDISELIQLNNEIEQTQKEVVFTMGAIGETRSKETGLHVKRVAEYSYLLAKLYGLKELEANLLRQASPMHDIGKVGIPDSILNKPGKLTFEEFEIMKTHSQLGYEMLKHSKRDILKASAIVALSHHEKWDGSGYPNNLAGDDIHIYGRITAIADVFDALGHDRCYKKAWPLEEILKLFKDQRGKHFEPKLIDLFMKNLDKFIEIRDSLQDEF